MLDLLFWRHLNNNQKWNDFFFFFSLANNNLFPTALCVVFLSFLRSFEFTFMCRISSIPNRFVRQPICVRTCTRARLCVWVSVLYFTVLHTHSHIHANSFHSFEFSCTKSESFKCVLCVMLDENNKAARQRRNAVLCCCFFRRSLSAYTHTYANTNTGVHARAFEWQMYTTSDCMCVCTARLSFNTVRIYVILESSPIPSTRRRLWILYT